MEISIFEFGHVIANRVSVKNRNKMANSVDPDEIIQYEPSHLDLHCKGRWFGLHGWKGEQIITKTRLYNSDLLKPHFYIVKLGFTGVYIIFLILL